MNDPRKVLKVFGVALVLVECLTGGALQGRPAAAVKSAGAPHAAAGIQYSSKELHGKLTFRSAVAMLACDRWRMRSRAQWFLMRASPARLPAILGYLRRAHSVEQAHRLLKIAVQMYLMARTPLLAGPVPFLGVRYAMQTLYVRWHGRKIGCAAAMVLQVFPGFPAAAKLRAADMIIGINGRFFPRWMTANDFRRRIQLLKPGDTVELMVIRGRGVRRVRVRLVGVSQDGGQLGAMMALRQQAAAEFIARYDRGSLTH